MDIMMGGTYMMGMCLMMLIGFIVVIAAIGFTVYIVARQLIKKCKVEDAPLRLLNERFIQGEIDEEEHSKKYSFLINRFRS